MTVWIRAVPMRQQRKSCGMHIKAPTRLGKIKADFVSGFEFETIVHLLCCFEDKDGTQNKFFSVLPKRCWSDYFSNKIVYNPSLDLGDETHEYGLGDEEESVGVSTDADDDNE